MSSPDRPKKPGIFASFAQSIAPRMPDPDTEGPLKRPTTVVIALVLATLGGALFLFSAAQMFLNIGSEGWNKSIVDAKTQYAAVINACETSVGGVGSAVPTTGGEPAPMTVAIPEQSVTLTASATQVIELCQRWPDQEPTEERINSLANEYRIVAGVQVLIGVLAILGAFLMRDGSIKLRRLVLGSVLLSLILSLMVSSSSTPVTLIGSLFLVAALVLCYVGRGGGFFIYQSAAKSKH